MKAFSGFRSEAKSSKPAQLPPGAYVAQIKAVADFYIYDFLELLDL